MSYKKILKKFFKENTIINKIPSAQALAHFRIQMESNPESAKLINDVIAEEVFKTQPYREGALQPERNEIEAVTSCEQIIRLMRRHTDTMNHQALIQKAMEFDSELVPELVERLKTSGNDGFIEVAIRILAKSTINVSEELISSFEKIRNVYAKSEVLVLLGFIADESHVPWLIEQYFVLKKQYPNESYCEGAYYALDEIGSRFYP